MLCWKCHSSSSSLCRPRPVPPQSCKGYQTHNNPYSRWWRDTPLLFTLRSQASDHPSPPASRVRGISESPLSRYVDTTTSRTINTPSPSLQAVGKPLSRGPPLAASLPIVAVLCSLLSSPHPTPAAAASPTPCMFSPILL